MRRQCCGTWPDQHHRSWCNEPLRPATAEQVMAAMAAREEHDPDLRSRRAVAKQLADVLRCIGSAETTPAVYTAPLPLGEPWKVKIGECVTLDDAGRLAPLVGGSIYPSPIGAPSQVTHGETSPGAECTGPPPDPEAFPWRIAPPVARPAPPTVAAVHPTPHGDWYALVRGTGEAPRVGQTVNVDKDSDE